jgi:hypothetical protein
MNALGIVFHDIVFRYIVYPGHNLAFFVAFTTEIGNIHLVGAGCGIAVMQDIVVTVTLLAAGSIGIIAQKGLSVDSSLVFFQFKGMAASAVNGFQLLGMWKTFISGIGVTGDAGVAVVDRVCKDGGIHKHGHRPAMERPGHGAVLMAHHTILVGLPGHQA